MKARFISLSWVACSCLLMPVSNPCQVNSNFALSELQAPSIAKGLFDTDEVLDIILTGKIKELLNDRSENPKNYPVLLRSVHPGGENIEIPVEVRTRGHFRRLEGNCTYPPLMIQFPKKGDKTGSIFSEQAKLKLVMPCRGDDYVIREWMVYKLYNLITPKSFRARLVKVHLEDVRNKKLPPPVYGILLEEEKQMARRNSCIAVEKKLQPKQTNTDAFLSMAVFQYLVGNTDWSVQYLQNIKLIAKDSGSTPYPVPYDFDHAGIVNAPYALPAEELKMATVRQRRYRGYCVKNLGLFEPVVADYNSIKKDIYGLYSGCKFLDQKYIKFTKQYLDQFYETINNPKAWKKEFSYPCDPKGTGNVVIRGLKTN